MSEQAEGERAANTYRSTSHAVRTDTGNAEYAAFLAGAKWAAEKRLPNGRTPAEERAWLYAALGQQTAATRAARAIAAEQGQRIEVLCDLCGHAGHTLAPPDDDGLETDVDWCQDCPPEDCVHNRTAADTPTVRLEAAQWVAIVAGQPVTLIDPPLVIEPPEYES